MGVGAVGAKWQLCDGSPEGVVARQMEKQVAGMQANGVSGVFSVANNLRVEND